MKLKLAFSFLLLANISFADQLAYITKEQATQAVETIKKMKFIFDFCGCCNITKPQKIKPKRVYKKHTGYEDYYEVYIDYIDKNGKTVSFPLDLAYVWNKKSKKAQTIGKLLDLNHDSCTHINSWKKHRKKEK